MLLNEEQAEAVNHVDGPCLVVASPGSGKTRVITNRVISLIGKGIDSGSILNITFTNKAAAEMKGRIVEGTNNGVSCFIGTFHSFCVQVLRRFGHFIGYSSSFGILDTNDSKDLISQIARILDKKIDQGEVSLILSSVNNWRENLELTDDKLLKRLDDKDHLLAIAINYLKKIKENNVLDFSGLLYETFNVIDSNGDVLGAIQKRFLYTQVDEVQDTNHVQFQIIEKINSLYNNIFLSGDLDQSIYAFRGSKVENIHNFLQKHKNCKVIKLNTNYRSTPEIIKIASNLISYNTNRLELDFKTNNSPGNDVQCLNFPNQIDESNWVADTIREIKEKSNLKYSDFAVLYRINRMSEPIEQALTKLSIPYQLIGNRSFYDRKEIKDCLAFLKLKVNPKDGISFHRIANLVDGVGDKTVGKIEALAIEKDISIFDSIGEYVLTIKSDKIRNGLQKIKNVFSFDVRDITASQSIAHIIKEFDYYKFITEKYPDDFIDRIDNVKQLIESSGNFSQEKGNSEKYLQMISLVSSDDDETNTDKVSVLSSHSSKGLEWNVVFVIGCEQGIIPHLMSMGDQKEIEEERRILYVSFTRAKKFLSVSFCKNRRIIDKDGKPHLKKCSPSQFLKECGLLDMYYNSNLSCF
jgi:DNA helicase II / ATP-dependent DNA helicase PcrA